MMFPVGIVREGGTRTNIIPEKASLEVSMRAPTDTELNTLKEKVVACFSAAATATGCQVGYTLAFHHHLTQETIDIVSLCFHSP